MKISQYWQNLQRSLFPGFEKDVGVQTPVHGHVMVVLDFIDFAHFFYRSPNQKGRPPSCRWAIARAFVAKSVMNLTSTKALLDRLAVDPVLRRLCGFDPTKKLPCEATFSNAFADIAKTDLLGSAHEALIRQIYSEHLDGKVVGHVSRDATDIAARGKVARVKKNDKNKRKNRVRGKNRRVLRQLNMDLDEMLSDLPKELNASTKRGHSWKGYKLHLDVGDGCVPLSMLLTSASLHDSQAAIPLEEMTSRRVRSFYSLMDSAYDSTEIRSFIAGKGKVAIIEPHNHPGQQIVLDPAERRRYGERTVVERAFSRLKDSFGARQVRVSGHAKVSAHIMFGVLALTADQLVRQFS